jgi:hypothetical protein
MTRPRAATIPNRARDLRRVCGLFSRDDRRGVDHPRAVHPLDRGGGGHRVRDHYVRRALAARLRMVEGRMGVSAVLGPHPLCHRLARWRALFTRPQAFPRFFHYDRAWISWKCPIDRAPPNPCGESMQAAYSRTAAERIVGNSESPQVELIGGFFGHRKDAGGRPRIRIPRHKPC